MRPRPLRPIPREILVHADWSLHPAKRFATFAAHRSGRWWVEAPAPAGPDFLERLLAVPTVAGFDFPIGLPDAWARRTGFPGFRAALEAFGEGEYARFFDVAERVEEVGPARPFYPARPVKGMTMAPFLAALGLAGLDDLHRACERATPMRRAASPLFWTLGANQVGKAALAGWREVVRPALARGAHLWPFDGPLAELPGTVIAECYPGEVYAHLGCAFGRNESKRRQADRARRAGALLDWAARHGVVLSPAAETAIRDGFGPAATGEDAFDSLIGLLGLIEVVDGHRAPGPERDPEITRFEGWILGQAQSSRR